MNDGKLIEQIKVTAKERFLMWPGGIHGIKHWDRVHENAVYLSKYTGADALVARLFAYLHDCCRESDGSDYEHGLRAAEFALSLRDSILKISDQQFELLHYACEFHEKGRITNDPTVGTCWDSDRLDLGRVAIKPNPKLLSTERARRAAVIDWAYKRSRGHKATIKG